MSDISSLDQSIKVGEGKFQNLRPNIEKKILWAHKPSIKTKLSLVFIHGFSASRSELSPVIENVAKELKANVFFTRLTGHGLDAKALGDATYNEWMKDTYDAIDIGKMIGDEVILIGCSTGCSLIHVALEHVSQVKSVIYVSPNFGPNSPKGQLLRAPGARWFVPLLFGKDHSFIAKNAEHARCWTTSYPSKVLFAVKDSVVSAHRVKHNKIKVPTLFWFSDDDQIVSAKATRRIIAKMGDNASVYNPLLTSEDDPSKHGILGDILSSSQTPNGVHKIVDWLKKN